MGISLMGLICYSGNHKETGVTCQNAVEEGFSVDRNTIDSWDKVGAAGPNKITMKCLENKKVRQDRTDNKTTQTPTSKKSISTDQLITMGY